MSGNTQYEGVIGSLSAVGTNEVPYTQFLPDVLPYVNGCADLVAVAAIASAVIEFCERTNWLLYEPAGINLTGQTAEYVLSLPTGGAYEVSQIMYLAYDGYELKGLPMEQIAETYGFDWRQVSGIPSCYTQIVNSSVIIAPWPIVAEPDAVTSIASLRPVRSATTVDASLYEKWFEIIAFGARARLHDTPNQPYYNERAAAKFRAYFQTGISRAKMARNQGLTRGPIIARPPRIV
jgi:hypothetical protein